MCVLLSAALMIICALVLGAFMKRLQLPGLVGMLLTGVLLGPYVLNLISPNILMISAELRQMALIVILLRAGLALDIRDLLKVGRPAFLMCFIPASFEIAATTFFAPLIFKMTYLEAALLGTVLGAVSPAVIVPKMLSLMEEGYGKSKSIPQLIMAGASVDDIYVIVLFTAFMGMYAGSTFDVWALTTIPIAIGLGVAVGVVTGLGLSFLLEKTRPRGTVKVLLTLAVSFLLVALEKQVGDFLPFSGLLGVMALGATLLKKNETLARKLSLKFSKIWVGAELMLFALVGATVDVRYVGHAGFAALSLIALVLVFRILGVFACLVKTQLTSKERLFCAIAYAPKATVQAAIGGLPLAAGVSGGKTILTVAVLAILLTAPLGAVGIDWTYRRFLTQEK